MHADQGSLGKPGDHGPNPVFFEIIRHMCANARYVLDDKAINVLSMGVFSSICS